VVSIALGVATLVATRALNETMTRAGLASINPMPGVADLVVSNGESTLAGTLAPTLAQVPGIQESSPRTFENVTLPDLNGRTALVMGIDFKKEALKEKPGLEVEIIFDDDIQKFLDDAKRFVQSNRKILLGPDAQKIFEFVKPLLNDDQIKVVDNYLKRLTSAPASDEAVVELLSRLMPSALVGEELKRELDQVPKKAWRWSGLLAYLPAKLKKVVEKISSPPLVEKFLSHLILVRKNGQQGEYVLRVGVVKARGTAAVLAGHTLTMDLANAAQVLGLEPGRVNRIDLTLKPGVNKNEVRREVEALTRGHGVVQTPEEQNRTVGNVMSGMQKGFALSGLAALVVGLFLVYNALAVCVAERRHEIGILLSLGASRRQIRLLFAGEAAVLGLAGSLLGIPLGIGLAYLGLQPMQEVLRDIFFDIQADQVEVSTWLVALALAAGLGTAMLAALIPAISASRENPAEAVRQVPRVSSWHYLAWHLAGALSLAALGLAFMGLRDLGFSYGAYAGMILVLLAALVAAPLVTAAIARLLQPFAQRFFPITWRLAADNLVRAPGRTGLVIAALAAGIALVTQTYGTIASNRTALRDWVQEYVAADLIVSSGSPVAAGGTQAPALNDALAEEIRAAIPQIEAVLPSRDLLVPYGDTQVKLYAFDAAGSYQVEKNRQPQAPYLASYKALGQTPHTAIVSENFAALHGVRPGDTIVLPARGQEVQLLVIGRIVDYSWNHGTIFVDRQEYKRWWDNKVKFFDVYVKPGADVERVKETLAYKFGAQNGLVVKTRQELQEMIDSVIERLYAIALSLQFVVMVVAALGVVMALLISVLQRRREMGLLRAIGASRSQVVRSFLAEAFLMGLIGTFIGFLVGIPMEWYVLKVLILQESGYLFAVYIPWREAWAIVGAGLLTPILAGLGPALCSARHRIPEAIAYE
jgi:putative ABC transport system permease protein